MECLPPQSPISSGSGSQLGQVSGTMRPVPLGARATNSNARMRARSPWLTVPGAAADGPDGSGYTSRPHLNAVTGETNRHMQLVCVSRNLLRMCDKLWSESEATVP